MDRLYTFLKEYQNENSLFIVSNLSNSEIPVAIIFPIIRFQNYSSKADNRPQLSSDKCRRV